MEYTTVKDVEIVTVGTHKGTTGWFSVSEEHVNAAVEASKTLPPAVVKIGHVNAAAPNPDWGDGAPAYGQISNLRVVDKPKGKTLVGDWVNVPVALAKKQPSAWPNRSMEGTYNMKLRDESGEIVEQYPFVLTGLALLGQTPPAVQNLEAVHASFSGQWDGHTVHASGGQPVEIFASLPGGTTAEDLRTKIVTAARNLGDYFVDDYDDEYAYLTDDSDGQTFRVAYTVAEDGTVVLSEEWVKVAVKKTYEPAESSNTDIPQDRVEFAQGVSKDAASEVANLPDKGESMFSEATKKAIRADLGLPEDATEEQVKAAISERAGDKPDGGTNDGGETNTQKDGEQAPAENPSDKTKAEEPVKEPELVAASQGVDTVTLSRAQFEEMVQDRQEMRVKLSAYQKTAQEEAADQAISDAKKAGKIHPKDEEAIRVMFSAAPEETKAYLDGLAGVIPTQEVGSHEAKFSQSIEQKLSAAEANAYAEAFGLPLVENEEAK